MPHPFDRTIAVIHYLLTKQRFAVGDGLVDLRRMLWYLDVSASVELGSRLTAFDYIKREDGPAPGHFAWVIGRMQSLGALGGGAADYLAYRTASLNPIRLADMTGFSDRQIAIIDRCFAIVSAAGYGGGRLSADAEAEKIVSQTPNGERLALPDRPQPLSALR
ncbi:hypothetical protein ACFQ4O_01230 [Methylopila musalis]|uniref:Antitoxin SocA-like Panacea domain-containing protein n=1 Tax=Methylopila musalis TaxID=1134781 RepID=A0ABW3Z3W7_9HYPH